MKISEIVNQNVPLQVVVNVADLKELFLDWKEESEYRRKPRTLTCTITIPEPLREAPEVGEVYYVAATYAEFFYNEHEWSGCATDIRFLKRGLCFTTKEDAIAAAKAVHQAFNSPACKHKSQGV